MTEVEFGSHCKFLPLRGFQSNWFVKSSSWPTSPFPWSLIFKCFIFFSSVRTIITCAVWKWWGNLDDWWLQEQRITMIYLTSKADEENYTKVIRIMRNKGMIMMINDLITMMVMMMATLTLPSTLCPVKKMLEGLSRTTWKFSKLETLAKHNLNSHNQTLSLKKTLATCHMRNLIAWHSIICHDIKHSRTWKARIFPLQSTIFEQHWQKVVQQWQFLSLPLFADLDLWALKQTGSENSNEFI